MICSEAELTGEVGGSSSCRSGAKFEDGIGGNAKAEESFLALSGAGSDGRRTMPELEASDGSSYRVLSVCATLAAFATNGLEKLRGTFEAVFALALPDLTGVKAGSA